MFKTIDELTDYETINATVTENKITRWYKKQRYWKLNFLLNEGVLRYRVEGNTMLNYFNVQQPIPNEGYILYVEQYINRTGKELTLIHSCRIIFRDNEYEVIEEKAHIKGKGVKRTIDIILNTCLGYFYYLDSLVKDKETIIKTPNYDSSTVKQFPNLLNKGSDNNIRLISNKKIVYEFTNLNNDSNLHKTIFTRRTESWSVIGHYRHYKNGKVVFIKPYTKGQGKKVNKIYKVK